MAVYESLLLNTAVPQIQAAQAGDSYVMVVNATTPALRITQTGTGNAISVEDETNPDATPFVVDASGNVGIGTSSPGGKLVVYGTSGTIAEVIENTSASGYSELTIKNSGASGRAYSIGVGGNSAASGFANNLYFYDGTASATRLTLDASGNLGLGVTPSASWGSSYKVVQIGAAKSLALSAEEDISNISTNAVKNSSAVWILQTTSSYKPTLYDQYLGQHRWHYGVAGSAGANASFTQAMTLDASGRLLVGATSASTGARATLTSAAQASGAACADSGILLYPTANLATGEYAPFITWSGNFSNPNRARAAIGAVSSSTSTALDLVFLTRSAADASEIGTGSERARITSGGYFKASNDGTYLGSTSAYHELRNNDAGNPAVVVHSTSASFGAFVIQARASINTTNNTFYALGYYNDAASAYRFQVADSGNVTNTNGSYGTISDQKMKTDIVDAGSQWSDIKALRFRKFKMKDDPDQIVQLGVVAQEVELTSPGLVDEHQDRDAEGNDLGTTTKSVKTSVLLMKAAVALQEAMARIETLEAKIAALEAK